MENRDIILYLNGISFSYPGGQEVLKDLNFKLHEGERVGLIGHNGSGKSTLLQLITGLLNPFSGNLELFGQAVKTEDDFYTARQRIGFLFQNADDQLFSPTVLEDVSFGPLNLGKSPEEALEMSMVTLKRLNLSGFEDRLTHMLSGGEKKLVSLATILVMEPKLLLLDEPISGLDNDTTEHITNILNGLDISFIIVSHEYDFLAQTTNRIYSMHNGRIEYDGGTETLHTHYHKHSMGDTAHKHD